MATGRRRAWTAVGLAAAAALTAAPAAASVGPLAAGPGGSAHFAWGDGAPDTLFHERRMAGDGTLSAVQIASQAYRSSDTQVVGVDAAGNALLAWRGEEGELSTLYTRRRAADGTLGPIQRVAPAGAHVDGFRLAVEPDGDAVYLWERVLTGPTVVQIRRRTAAGVLGPVKLLSYAASEAYGADLAVAPDGTATASWLRQPSSGGNISVQTRTIAPDHAVKGRIRQPNGTLGPVFTLASPALYPQVALDPSGNATFAWEAAQSGSQAMVVSRRRSVGGVLGPARPISAPADDAHSARLAVDADGKATVAWHVAGDGGGYFARTVTAGGTVSSPKLISGD